MLNIAYKRILALICSAAILGGALSASASVAGPDPRAELEHRETHLPYSEVKLSAETKSVLAKINGDVELLLLSSESEYACGELLEYYYNFKAEDKGVYATVLNTLKTIAEYNDYIKLKFIDLNSVYSKDSLTAYENYSYGYGDLIISCYSNFDGSAKTRKRRIAAENLFKFVGQTDENKEESLLDEELLEALQNAGIILSEPTEALKIERQRTEETVCSALEGLQGTRVVNVAYLEELCTKADVERLDVKLGGKYSFSPISFSEEKLMGYDILLIASPYRDITLEEAAIIEAYLSNSRGGGKTLAYFSPEEYISLKNLYNLLAKWGIYMAEDYRLKALGDEGWFVDKCTLYAQSTFSEYSSQTDKTGAFYLMDECTPMMLMEDGEAKVTPIIKTKSDYFSLKKADRLSEHSPELNEIVFLQDYPLLAISERAEEDKNSYVIACSSASLINSYFAQQEAELRLEKNPAGEHCGNLELIDEVFSYIKEERLEEPSGLKNYVITRSELGYEKSSGILKNDIMAVAIGGSALLLLICGVFIIISINRRKKFGTQKKR